MSVSINKLGGGTVEAAVNRSGDPGGHSSMSVDVPLLSAAISTDLGGAECAAGSVDLGGGTGRLNIDGIPEVLKRRPQWVLWKKEKRDGKDTKVPYSVNGNRADTTNPATWCGLDLAMDVYGRGGFDGIGFVFSPDDPYCGVDMDDCRNPVTGDVESWAKDIIEDLYSYAEVSWSGEGVHILVEGAVPGPRRRKGNIEMYDKARYFVVTGHHIEGTPCTIEERQSELDALYKAKFGEDKPAPVQVGTAAVTATKCTLTDDEILNIAISAKNGAKFGDLWKGDWQSHYPSQSEADAFMLGLLRFYTGGDKDRAFAMFAKSGLVRSKWTDRADYREGTWRSVDSGPVYGGGGSAPAVQGQPNVIILPSNQTEISAAAKQIFTEMASRDMAYNRGGAVCEVREDADRRLGLAILSPEALRTRIEKLGPTMGYIVNQRGQINLAPKRPSTDNCKAMIAATEMGENLNPVANVYAKPVLVLANGALRLLMKGYTNVNGGAFVSDGDHVPDIGVAEAAGALDGLLVDFQFASNADKTRALGLIMTTALRLGGFLRYKCPLFAIEADQSQTGKGYMVELNNAIYSEDPVPIGQKTKGVGSFDESLQAALLVGHPIIQFDNLRGKLDSAYLEMVITAPHAVSCRIPYQGEVKVDATRFLFVATSNGFESTTDLANRSCIIRLRKQPDDYQFKKWEGGSLVDHVKANQPYYLGCVHSVIRAWWAAGAPRSEATGHDFRDWARMLGGVLGIGWPKAAPLLEGHRQSQVRTSTPALAFLRAVCVACQTTKQLEISFGAADLARLCSENEIEIPGLRDAHDDAAAAKTVGSIMGRSFKDLQAITVEEFTIARSVAWVPRNDGPGSFESKRYTVLYTSEASLKLAYI